jgi:hypothetical protein
VSNTAKTADGAVSASTAAIAPHTREGTADAAQKAIMFVPRVMRASEYASEALTRRQRFCSTTLLQRGHRRITASERRGRSKITT